MACLRNSILGTLKLVDPATVDLIQDTGFVALAAAAAAAAAAAVVVVVVVVVARTLLGCFRTKIIS